MKRLIWTFLLAGCTLQPGSGCLVPGQTAADALDVEACEHLSGPAKATLTATPSVEGAPAIPDHGRHDVALTANQAGHVQITIDEAVDVAVYLNQPVALTLLAASAGPVAPLASASGAQGFGAIKAKSLYHLEAGTYHLKLGPAAVATVGVVVEEDEEEAGEGHDHGH